MRARWVGSQSRDRAGEAPSGPEWFRNSGAEMKGLRIVVLSLALLQAGWITLDGARALMTGRYWTPRFGSYGGRTGPWTRVASASGIDPRSREAKWALIAFGTVWLGAVFAFARGAGWVWWVLLVAAVGALWYSTPTIPISLAQILLLLTIRRDL